MKKCILILYSVLLLIAFGCDTSTKKGAQEKEGSGEKKENVDNLTKKIADAYGINEFKKIDTLSFTFHVRPKAEADTISRNWLWVPASNYVVFNANSEPQAYRRDSIKSEKWKKIDAMFINDQYWLLFPFHLVWDKGVTFKTRENDKMPFSDENAQSLEVAYNSEAGYTPGDIYKLYLKPNFTIAEWEYTKGGTTTPAITTTWEDDETFQGITIAKMHHNDKNGFAIWFDDLEIE